MKNNLQTNPLLFKLLVLITCFMLVIFYNQSKAAGVYKSPGADKIAVNIQYNPDKHEVRITLKASTEKTLHLFFFDVDSNPVEDVVVNAQTTTVMKAPEKGFYMYECFDEDVRVKSGTLIIK